MIGQQVGGTVGRHQAVAGEGAEDEGALDGQRAGQETVLARARVVAAVDDRARQARQIARQRRDHARHTAQRDLAVVGIELQREPRLHRRHVVGPDQQHDPALARALRAAVHAGRKFLEQVAMLGGRQLDALLVRPRQPHGIGPDGHRRRAGHRAERVAEGHLGVTLAEERQLDAEQPADALHQRPGGRDETRRGDRVRAAGALDPHPADAAARGLHAGHAALQQSHALVARTLEQVHAELLAAEPAAAPRVQQRHGVLGEPAEVAADERAVGDHVGADRLLLEPVGRRRPIFAGRMIVEAESPRAEGRRLASGAQEAGHTLGVGGGEQIAPPVHAKHVAALPGEVFQQVDAAVHQRDHVVPGTRPPVAVALGRLVARERQRGPLVDEDDVGEPPAHREMVGGGDAGDAGAADDHLRGVLAHTGARL